jgi:hypothetical protein
MLNGFSGVVMLGLAAMAPLRIPCAADPAFSGSTSSSASVVDDGDAGWVWSGLSAIEDAQLSNGTGHAGGFGSYGAYTFKGTGVKIYGMRGPSISIDGQSHKMGRVKVTVDGKDQGEYSEFHSVTEYDYLIADVSGLTDGNHVVQLSASGGWIVIDSLKIAGGKSASGDASELSKAGYRIFPRSSTDKCIETENNGTTDGALIQIASPAEHHVQVWRIASLGSNRYRISPADNPDEALTILAPDDQHKAPQAFIWKYTGAASQQILLLPSGDGFYKVAPSNSPDNVLDVAGQIPKSGTPVLCFPWWGGPNQQWWVAKVPDGG